MCMCVHIVFNKLHEVRRTIMLCNVLVINTDDDARGLYTGTTPRQQIDEIITRDYGPCVTGC